MEVTCNKGQHVITEVTQNKLPGVITKYVASFHIFSLTGQCLKAFARTGMPGQSVPLSGDFAGFPQAW